MLSYCCTNNAHRLRLSLRSASATATFNSATYVYIVLYTHRCSRHNYRAASIRCRGWHQQTSVQPNLLMSTAAYCDNQVSTTTIVVDDTAYSSASASSWTRTTVADEHKYSAERRLSRRLLDRSKNAILPTPPVFSAPSSAWFHRNFEEIFCVVKLESIDYRAALSWRSYV